MSNKRPTANLDDLLLDVATIIEPSNSDQRIIDSRYQNLKTHLERPSSPLAEYLRDDESRIYPQGSVSISTTIISGEKGDRYDVDAMVEFEVPLDWPDDKALDVLYDALQGFPGAKKIIRNTRCVTVQFAFMHMDVTIMDPEQEPRTERIGEIFHSPDTGESYRVPSNPFGFSYWFRRSVTFQEGPGTFAEQISKRRLENYVDRLQSNSFRAADQDELPPMIPPRMDAQQVVALKLMKRILNVEYQNKAVKKPPTIYTTKMASDCGYEPLGLTAQLEKLATHIRIQMAAAITVCNGPDERNPTYQVDCINDRWPRTQEDRQVFHTVMGKILRFLEKAKSSTFADIAILMNEAFGENISKRAVEKHLTRRDSTNSARVIKSVGTVVPTSILTTPAIARETRVIPDHHFHCEGQNDDEKDN